MIYCVFLISGVSNTTTYLKPIFISPHRFTDIIYKFMYVGLYTQTDINCSIVYKKDLRKLLNIRGKRGTYPAITCIISEYISGGDILCALSFYCKHSNSFAIYIVIVCGKFAHHNSTHVAISTRHKIWTTDNISKCLCFRFLSSCRQFSDIFPLVSPFTKVQNGCHILNTHLQIRHNL